MLAPKSVLAAAVFAAALGVHAQAAAAPDERARLEELAKTQPNKLICTRERQVGSNRTRKVCLTAAQRLALRAQAQDQLGRMRDGGACHELAGQDSCGGLAAGKGP